MSGRYKRSPIVYMGNKFLLLDQLIPLFPLQCDTFVDLFGGSGVVSMNYKGSKRNIYNELNENVFDIVDMIKNTEPNILNDKFESIINNYGLVKNGVKYNRDDVREQYKERETAFYKLREDYNKSLNRSVEELFLLMCYSINNLIRFNGNGDFNAPSGDSCYNNTRFSKIKNMHNKFKNIEIYNKNAFAFDLSNLSENDFVYLDPPYSNTNAIYNEKRGGGWDIDSDYKLFNMLENLNKKGVRWGMSNVLANRGITNKHLEDWCKKNNFNINYLDITYTPFASKTSEKPVEVYICNYKTQDNQISLFELL